MAEVTSKMNRGKIAERQSGAATLEFALAATLFFSLLLGAVIWALVMWQVNTAQHAVERGARCAILPYPPGDQPRPCGDSPTAYAATQSFGLNNVTDSSYVSSQSVFGSGATAFIADCVTSSSSMTPITGSMQLIRLGSGALTVSYCRPQQ